MTRRRRASLWCALTARESGDAVERMLRRHCDAEAVLEVGAEGEAGTLTEIFVVDLKDALRRVGRPASRRSPKFEDGEVYWYGRYELARLRLWQERSPALPRYWRALAACEPVAFEQACVDVGAEMVGYAALLESSSDVIRWLAPLGGKRARQVVDRFDVLRRNPIADDLANRWHYAYSRKTQLHKGKRVQFALGFELVATAYQRLTTDERYVMEVVLEASIRSALEQSQEAELMPVKHGDRIGQLLDRILACPGGQRR